MFRQTRYLFILVFCGLAGLFALLGGGRLIASTLASGNIPELMNFQGYLTDAGGSPLSGAYDLTFRIYDASTGGIQQWQESHAAVPVSQGNFAVLLGSQGSPLTPSIFSDESRYVEVTVAGGPPLPRQRLASVPYALQAYQAQNAVQSTFATTATTATTATVALSVVGGGSGGYAQTIVVAKSGGDFTSVADALSSIGDASAAKPYLVYVAAGVYSETNLVDVKPYIHLQGAGQNATVIVSTRSSTSASTAAATVLLQEHGLVSDLTIRNLAATDVAVGLYSSSNAEYTTTIDRVAVEATGNGGIEHHALFLSDAFTLIKDSSLRADGAATNVALEGRDAVSPLSLATVEGSILEGGPASVTPGKFGYGVRVQDQRIAIRNSYVRGTTVTMQTARVDFPSSGPNSTIENSRIEGYGQMLDAQTGTAIRLAATQFIGTGSVAGTVVCFNAYDANFSTKPC